MADTLTSASICANHQCKHPLSDHTDYGCVERILTVLDTEANCSCVAFTTDPEDSWRNLQDYQGRVRLCALCDAPLGPTSVDGAHVECVTAVDPDRGQRCRSCGGKPYSCPCTTGQSSTYFTRSML